MKKQSEKLDLYRTFPSLRVFEKHYRLVDDRHTFTHIPNSGQGTNFPKTSFTFHYYGSPVPIGTPESEYSTLLSAYDIHITPGNFDSFPGQGTQADGIQYHIGVMSDRAVFLRDPNRVTWHSGSAGNETSLALFFPLGSGQRPYGEMWRIAVALVECLGRDMGIKNPLSKVRGHREWVSTRCPGDVMHNIGALRTELARNPTYHFLSFDPPKPEPKPEPPKPKERWSHELPGVDGKPRKCGSGYYALYKGAGANAERYFGRALSEETDAVFDGTKGTVMHFENVSFGYFPGKKHVSVLMADEMRKLRWNI